MYLFAKLEREIKEDECLGGHEICLLPDEILVSKELYKIVEVIHTQEDRISKILNKAIKISESTLEIRRLDNCRKEMLNLSKHSRRKASSSKRRTII